MGKFDFSRTLNKITKNYKKLPIGELKIEEGKIMNKITGAEKELAELNQTLDQIRKLIKEKSE